jgi:predicted RNA-binding protein YlxR (DUF448 family)
MNPVRTCVGCRQRANQSSLIRIVVKNNQLVIDQQKNLAGSGASIHPESKCLAQAIERRAFQRALRLGHSFDPAGLDLFKEQAETMLAKNE